MKVIAVNGSPRKGWNTHILLEKALEGAAEAGAETEMVNLYDLDYKGCRGCLGCKRRGGVVGRCVINDGLKPVLDGIAQCDGLILGSPIYVGEVTGELRSLIERLTFQYISYDKMDENLFGRKMKTGFIYTTNCPEEHYEAVGYTRLFNDYKAFMTRIFSGECMTLGVSETWQIDDYDKYHMGRFNVEERRKRREEVFPLDCKKAFDMGKWVCSADSGN
ncbi:MAG: flavodoxin family protein [Oscillospiraceae bacterium]|nr:flavodoxin family protein [Oscillospiraceae bacterium]